MNETATKRVVAEFHHEFGIVTSIIIIEDNAKHLRYAIGKKTDDGYKLKIISEREFYNYMSEIIESNFLGINAEFISYEKGIIYLA